MARRHRRRRVCRYPRGFSRGASIDDIRHHHYVLTPGRYVGAAATDEPVDSFEEKMHQLAATLGEQRAAPADALDAVIASNLRTLGYGG